MITRITDIQSSVGPSLERLVDTLARSQQTQPAAGGDEAMRAALKGIETLLARLIDETQAGRAQFTQDIRNEFRLLARTIAALADDQR
jgi:hypothetical protein